MAVMYESNMTWDMVLLLVFNKLCSARLLPMMIKSKSAPSWIASKTWIMSVYWPNVLSIVLRNQGSQLAQRRCHNVMVRSKMRVVQTSVSDVVTTSLSDVIKTLPQRCCNVATTFSIGFLGHFTTDYSDFFPFIETWESYKSAKWH